VVTIYDSDPMVPRYPIRPAVERVLPLADCFALCLQLIRGDIKAHPTRNRFYRKDAAFVPLPIDDNRLRAESAPYPVQVIYPQRIYPRTGGAVIYQIRPRIE
jgi:hypothetical protein